MSFFKTTYYSFRRIVHNSFIILWMFNSQAIINFSVLVGKATLNTFLNEVIYAF